jgi:hypothetical protein
MSFELIGLLGAILVTITASIMLISDDWRVYVDLLALRYQGLCCCCRLLAMSISHLVAGWIAGAVLGMAMLSLPYHPGETKDIEHSGRSTSRLAYQLRLGSDRSPNIIFLLLSIFLVALAVFSQTPRLSNWIPGLGLTQAWGGLILIGIACFSLVLRSIRRVTIGLLTLLSGFLILYSAVNITHSRSAIPSMIQGLPCQAPT